MDTYPPIDKRLIIKLAKEKVLGHRSSAAIARLAEAKLKRPVSDSTVRKILKAAGIRKEVA